MTDRLNVWLDGSPVGTLDRGADGDLTFIYDEAYRTSQNPTPLSVSLPLTRSEHRHESVFPWIDNLLPDNDQVRSRWAVEFDERRPTPFALLSHMGADCAGAVQFLRTDETPGADGGVVPVTDSEIAAHLRALHTDDTAWTFEECGGRWSLGGQQGKFALSFDGKNWGIPTGTAPSTHIVKIGISHLDESDAAEFVTMRAAAHLGLPVAHSELMRFGDQSAVVVERFDRRAAPGRPTERVHQEDFCQALGLSRHQKYQADGGPALSDLVAVLGQAIRPQRVEHARRALAEATLFNWLVAGTDAHAKNFALIHIGGVSALAPLYDLMSAVLVQDSREVYYKGKLAMKLAGRYDLRRIDWSEIEKTAVELRVDADWIVQRGHELHTAMPEAFAAAVADAADVITPEVGKRFNKSIDERAGQTRPR